MTYQRKSNGRKRMILEKLVQISRHGDHINGVDELGIDELVRDLIDRVFVGQELELDVLQLLLLIAHSQDQVNGRIRISHRTRARRIRRGRVGRRRVVGDRRAHDRSAGIGAWMKRLRVFGVRVRAASRCCADYNSTAWTRLVAVEVETPFAVRSF